MILVKPGRWYWVVIAVAGLGSLALSLLGEPFFSGMCSGILWGVILVYVSGQRILKSQSGVMNGKVFIREAEGASS